MRANEFENKKQPIKENIFSNLAAGLAGTAGSVADAFKNPYAKKNFGVKGDKLAKDIFVKKFVSGAMDALNTAMKHGLGIKPTPVTPEIQAARDKQAAARKKAQTELDSQKTPATPAVSKQSYQSLGKKMATKGKKVRQLGESQLQEIYKKLTTQEKFKRELKKAGYDPDLAAKRIEDLLAKHRRDRKEREEQEQKMGLEEGFPPRKYQRPAKLTKPVTQQPTTPAAPPKPTTPASTTAPSTSTTQEPLSWGGEKYTKGPKGWVDSKGKPADINTSNVLDQAATQASASAPKQKQPQQQAPQQQAPKQQNQKTNDLPELSAWFKQNFMDKFLVNVDTSSAESAINNILKRIPQDFNNKSQLQKDLTDLAEIGWTLSPKD